jgi:hypothetical protein
MCQRLDEHNTGGHRYGQRTNTACKYLAVRYRNQATQGVLGPRCRDRSPRYSGRLACADGLFHLIEAPGHLDEQIYIGVLFWLTVAASWLAAVGIASGVRGSWILGALVAAATFFGLILAVTVGLPNFSENLSENLAVPSLFVEAGYLVLYVAASTGRSNPLGT